jgi:Domain of unknown function (DUF4440)
LRNSRDVDRRFLQDHIGDDLLFQRADGTVVGKKEFLEKWKGGSPFTARFVSDVTANLQVGEPNRGVVTLLIHAIDKLGAHHVYRNLRFCEKRGAKWQIYAWYNAETRSST